MSAEYTVSTFMVYKRPSFILNDPGSGWCSGSVRKKMYGLNRMCSSAAASKDMELKRFWLFEKLN